MSGLLENVLRILDRANTWSQNQTFSGNISAVDITGSGNGNIGGTLSVTGALTVGGAAINAAGLTQIGTLTPTGATADFTSIPQTYRGLVLYWNGISSNTASRAFQVNCDTGGGFGGSYWNTTISGSTVTANAISSFFTGTVQIAASTSTGVLMIPGYQSGAYKHYTAYMHDNTASTPNQISVSGILQDTAGITGLRGLWNGSGNFDLGTITLFGIK